jgi:hypothetical protein
MRRGKQRRDSYAQSFLVLFFAVVHARYEVVDEEWLEYTESATGPHIRGDTPAALSEILLIDQVDDSVKHAARSILITRKESQNGGTELGEPETGHCTWEATRKPHVVCDKRNQGTQERPGVRRHVVQFGKEWVGDDMCS